MKKIWPLLLALLLWIIFCVWTKYDKIDVSSNHPQNITKEAIEVVSPKKHYINYEIMQEGNTYTLNGNFTNLAQQRTLSDTYTAASSNLNLGNVSTNEILLGEDAILLTNKILPHFIQHYQNGKIVYSNQTLRISGKVDSYEAQHQMQRLLNSSTLASQDNSTVTIEKPISFLITKKGNEINMNGQFSNEAQSAPIQTQLPSSANIHLSNAKNLIDNGAVSTTQYILPLFIAKYTEGSITYRNKQLTVTGMVSSESDLNSMHTLFANADIPIIDNTTIDTKALEEARAREEAERKAEEARTAQLAQNAANKAKEEEANRIAQELEEKRLTQEEEKKKAKALQEKESAKKTEVVAAKKNIVDLLQIQNIEFNVAKGSLTPRGKATVDKLSNILQQYPHIKIEIAGHTDSDGSAIFNQNLSQKRVDTVKARLITKGIDTSRLTARGYGESKPLVPNTSGENKQKNRRVEINIQGE